MLESFLDRYTALEEEPRPRKRKACDEQCMTAFRETGQRSRSSAQSLCWQRLWHYQPSTNSSHRFHRGTSPRAHRPRLPPPPCRDQTRHRWGRTQHCRDQTQRRCTHQTRRPPNPYQVRITIFNGLYRDRIFFGLGFSLALFLTH